MEIHQPHRCYIRQYWSQAWSEVPYLYANSFTDCAAPDIGRAQLFYRSGQIQRAGQTVSSIYGLDDYSGWYVKIELDQPDGSHVHWYGVILERERDRYGGREIGGVRL